jgi:hypothetical protein
MRTREWVGGVFTAPFEVAEPQLHRPELALWMVLPEGVIAHIAVLGPHSTDSFASALRTAMGNVPGPRAVPERVRVASDALAAELRGSFGDALAVRVAPTPELRNPQRELARSLRPGSDDRSYLGRGRISEGVVAELFRHASYLWTIAPWRGHADSAVIRIDAPELEVRGACLVVIGGLGESLGFLLFPSLAAFERFNERAESAQQRGSRELDLGTDLLSLEFLSETALSPTMLREIEEHGWPVGKGDAYPVVERRTRRGEPAPASQRDVRLIIGCASALSAFCAQHPAHFSDDEIEPVSVSYSMDGVPTVRLTCPPDSFELFDVEPAPPGFGPLSRVGRNDPCPCGSGRKYKRCCLDVDTQARSRAASGEAEHNPVHVMDGQLVDELRGYAAARFGVRWTEAAEKEAPIAVQPALAYPWSVYGVHLDDRPVVAHFLDAPPRRLPAKERSWLEAQTESWLSLWECLAIDRGQSLRLRDLLTGEERTVEERSASSMLGFRDTLLARIVDHDGSAFLCGCHTRVLPPAAAAEIADRVRASLRAKGAVAPERLRRPAVARDLLKRWDKMVKTLEARAKIPPRLTNRDGDEILLTVDRFALAERDRAEVERRLSAIPGVSPPERENGALRFAFTEATLPGRGTPQQTVLGFASLDAHSLRVETNSVARADALRALVEERCQGLLRHRVREHTDPAAPPVQEAFRARPEREIPPEAQQLLLDFKARHYAAWLDEPIPALRGRTPRDAAQTAEGRRALDALLKEMEHAEGRAPEGERFDFAIVRRALGVEG